jgi:shikimate kinase
VGVQHAGAVGQQLAQLGGERLEGRGHRLGAIRASCQLDAAGAPAPTIAAMSAARRPPRPPLRHIALVGLMGVGKTTVGRLLAGSLGWPLADSDGEIEAREGASVREIQRLRGAPALHELEAAVLLEQLDAPGPSVICAAASTIEDERCRRRCGAGRAGGLACKASLDTLVARYDSDPHRPRYPEGTRAALARTARRALRALCGAVAAMTIEVDGPGAGGDRRRDRAAGRTLGRTGLSGPVAEPPS